MRVQTQTGKIKFFSRWKKHGLICGDDGEIYHFLFKHVEDIDLLKINQPVKFIIKRTCALKLNLAQNVREHNEMREM